jgi:hypothetical protein
MFFSFSLMEFITLSLSSPDKNLPAGYSVSLIGRSIDKRAAKLNIHDINSTTEVIFHLYLYTLKLIIAGFYYKFLEAY